MFKEIYTLIEEAERVKKLAEVSLMMDVLIGLLVSKGILTEDEISEARTAQLESSPYHDYEASEAEESVRIFRIMERAGVEARLKNAGVMDESGALIKTAEEKPEQKRDIDYWMELYRDEITASETEGGGWNAKVERLGLSTWAYEEYKARELMRGLMRKISRIDWSIAKRYRVQTATGGNYERGEKQTENGDGGFEREDRNMGKRYPC